MKARTFALLLAVALPSCSGGAGTPFVTPAAGVVDDAPSTSSAGAYRDAPYVDMSSWPPPQLTTYASHTSNRYYTLAFVQSYKGTQCEASWGGAVLPTDPTNGPYYTQQLNAIRRMGGDGIVSFGGAAGTDLAMACTDASSLAAAIEAIVDYYHAARIDFDIEGNAPYDLPSVARRSQALRMVQDHYGASAPVISYTLPVIPSGLPSHILGVVQSALEAGVKISIVNVMTMDFGNGAAPNPSGRMGAYSIESAKNALKELKKIKFPFGANPYSSIGITPMIGVNDVSDEIFEPSDAAMLVAWAKQNGVGRLAFWAQQRDKTCAGGATTRVSDKCSGIVQSPYTFGKAFAAL